MSLCDLSDRRRAETIRYLKMQADLAAECGYSTFGVPSGPYPGDEFHDEAMAVQADTLARIADYTALLGMNCSIEPLDRYAHKKALIGPMDEVVPWFKPLHRAHPNLFLHWDSAHEQLGGLGIYNTLDMAAPYLSQIHLCDCIDDPAHPCFGDLHMDPAEAPEWIAMGGYVDFTAGLHAPDYPKGLTNAQAVKQLRDAGCDMKHVTFSTDGNGVHTLYGLEFIKRFPLSLMHEAVVETAQLEGVTLSEALSYATSNTADSLGLKTKGRIQVGKDADLILLNKDDLAVDTVLSRGLLMVEHGERVNRGRLDG